jgi:hypothetical protein
MLWAAPSPGHVVHLHPNLQPQRLGIAWANRPARTEELLLLPTALDEGEELLEEEKLLELDDELDDDIGYSVKGLVLCVSHHSTESTCSI